MGKAPDALLRLVDRFDSDRKVFQSTDYKEEQLRAEFLNPFFTVLGWDMDNKQGLSETFKQVIALGWNGGGQVVIGRSPSARASSGG